jgi:O-antigen ligase
MSKSPRNQKGKEKIGYWLLNQLGKHFWPDFSIVAGIRIDYLSPTLYVTDILLSLLFLCFLCRNYKSRPPKQSRKNIVIAGIVFAFLLSNIFFAGRLLLGVYGFIKLCEFAFLAFYIAKTIQSRMQLTGISLFFTIGLIFESLLAILQYINQGSLGGLFYFFGERTFTGTTPGIANASINGILVLRPYATFSHPNVLAAYLLVSIILVWNFILKNDKRSLQILGAVALFIGSIALLVTFSRVVILLWAFMAAVVLIRRIKGKVTTMRTRLIALIVTCFSLLVIVFLPLTHEVFNRLAQTSLTDESVTERVELVTASWKMIQQNPIIGVGLDNYIPSLVPFQKPLPLGLYLQPVHNIFILVLAETGVLGFGLFIVLFAKTFMRLRKQEKGIKELLFLLLLIIIITGMFDHYWLTLQQGQLLFSLVIGLCWTKLDKSTT